MIFERWSRSIGSVRAHHLLGWNSRGIIDSAGVRANVFAHSSTARYSGFIGTGNTRSRPLNAPSPVRKRLSVR